MTARMHVEWDVQAVEVDDSVTRINLESCIRNGKVTVNAYLTIGGNPTGQTTVIEISKNELDLLHRWVLAAISMMGESK